LCELSVEEVDNGRGGSTPAHKSFLNLASQVALRN
jgi:hypothetical protein